MEGSTIILLLFGCAVLALAIHGAAQVATLRSDEGGGRIPTPRPPDEDTPATREHEVRQYVRARNEYRRSRGEQPRPEDAEVQRLLGAALEEDEDLRADARVLVERENDRRRAAGRATLDVEAEVTWILRRQGA